MKGCPGQAGTGLDELIVVQQQPLKVGKILQVGRYRTVQLVVIKVQLFQDLRTGHIPQLGRYGSSQSVGPETQVGELGQTAQLRRNDAREIIAAQIQLHQVG